MKLLYIANIRLPTEKAHGIQIMKMCEAFTRQGVEVELMVPRRINHIKDDPFEYYSVEKNFKITKIPTLDLVRWGRVGFWIQSLSFAGFSFFYSSFRKVDVIYSRDELPLFFLSFFKKNLFWEAHTNRWNFIIKRVLMRSRGIITVTDGLRDFFIKKGGRGNKIITAHDGVDLEMFKVGATKSELRKRYNIPESKKVVGYVGKLTTMGKEKGVKELIESFSQVLKSTSEAFLLLVGANEDEILATNKIFKELHISKNSYKIVPHLPQKDIPPYLKVSDVLVMNYPSTEHYKYYMSPLKLFEYMASGVPIVSSDLLSVREVLSEKNSVLIEPDNTKALVRGIKRIFDDEMLASDIASTARKDVEGYSWKKRAYAIMNFIELNERQNP